MRFHEARELGRQQLSDLPAKWFTYPGLAKGWRCRFDAEGVCWFRNPVSGSEHAFALSEDDTSVEWQLTAGG